MNCVSHDVLSRVNSQVVYIIALHSSLDTTTFCFLHVCPFSYLTSSIQINTIYVGRSVALVLKESNRKRNQFIGLCLSLSLPGEVNMYRMV